MIKRSPLKRATKPINPMSAKRKAQVPARKRCVEIVLARDKTCFMVNRGIKVYQGAAEIKCWGPLDVHEPGHRSQGADPTDPNQCVAICRRHHGWAHDHPKLAKEIGV